MRGVEIRWAILDAPPLDIVQLIHSEFDAKTPLDIEFGEADRSKKVYLCGRWKLTVRGLRG
jgi:hypothetical protein